MQAERAPRLRGLHRIPFPEQDVRCFRNALWTLGTTRLNPPLAWVNATTAPARDTERYGPDNRWSASATSLSPAFILSRGLIRGIREGTFVGMEDLGAEDPRWIGEYRLLKRLGAGGMGRVFLAYSARGRTVAVKLVQTELAQQAEFRRRFTQEVRAAQRVGGAWTAPVLDADTEAATPWVATGYIAGPSLHAVVAESGPLPERTVRILGNGLTRALQSIHGAGLVHRDLKPSNILVTIDGPRVIETPAAAPVRPGVPAPPPLPPTAGTAAATGRPAVGHVVPAGPATAQHPAAGCHAATAPGRPAEDGGAAGGGARTRDAADAAARRPGTAPRPPGPCSSPGRRPSPWTSPPTTRAARADRPPTTTRRPTPRPARAPGIRRRPAGVRGRRGQGRPRPHRQDAPDRPLTGSGRHRGGRGGRRQQEVPLRGQADAGLGREGPRAQPRQGHEGHTGGSVRGGNLAHFHRVWKRRAPGRV
ncbi:serine/threonine-protein kinase AfsK [Streptomyces himastatinicus ATCC 53653]|uniref:Serine/threonine-protein kinase AfsK n=1 Tax=Streptomyces himastatinicus ATCC 53653 TaxID=457427 RepID=D9WVS0_9ACTN|nr:serine/threonine-protein kinase AfsK [Streptomyces himastatinicus ATCC 53653]